MKLIHELIHEHAAAFPDKTALSDAFGEMTYRELAQKSEAVTYALASLGVKAGDAVAVYVPYVKEIMLGALSAWQTGCIFIPLDEAYPEKRLEYILEDAHAAAVLTVRGF